MSQITESLAKKLADISHLLVAYENDRDVYEDAKAGVFHSYEDFEALKAANTRGEVATKLDALQPLLDAKTASAMAIIDSMDQSYECPFKMADRFLALRTVPVVPDYLDYRHYYRTV